MRYVVIIERADTNYSAYVPDLPGCVNTDRAVEETARNIWEALDLYLEGMRADDDPIPEPTTFATMIAVDRPGAPAARAFDAVS